MIFNKTIAKMALFITMMATVSSALATETTTQNSPLQDVAVQNILAQNVTAQDIAQNTADTPNKLVSTATLPILSESTAQAGLSATDLGATTLNHSSAPLALIATAKRFIGTPYRAGGTTPAGFDCSGFVQYVFKSANISLPRSSRDMAGVGVQVARQALQAGDMVFFAHSGRRISHVGMYVGDGKFIHSPSTGKTVEIVSLNSSYWNTRFITARRVLG